MLKWTFRGGYDGHEWNASETEKWYYSIALKCDETGNVSFVADRMSTNDGLAHEDIGDLQQESATLEEAKSVSEKWSWRDALASWGIIGGYDLGTLSD